MTGCHDRASRIPEQGPLIAHAWLSIRQDIIAAARQSQREETKYAHDTATEEDTKIRWQQVIAAAAVVRVEEDVEKEILVERIPERACGSDEWSSAQEGARVKNETRGHYEEVGGG